MNRGGRPGWSSATDNDRITLSPRDMERAAGRPANESRQQPSRINPRLESFEMADCSRQTGGFLPFAFHGGIVLCMAAYLSVNGSGNSPAHAQADAPCMKIRSACTDAGFKPGFAKDGIGLEADCISPVMQGVPQRAKATKPLPHIDADLIAACKAKRPDFGQRGRASPQSSSGDAAK